MLFGFADESYVSTFLLYLAIAGAAIAILTCFVISDEEDTEGLFGKGEALTKGVLYKRFGYFYYTVLFAYLLTLVCALRGTNLETTLGGVLLIVLLIFNLCVPFVIFVAYDPARLKEMIGEASETEKFIGGKGVDHDFSEVASGMEFWYTCVISMIVIGSSKMVLENTGPFSLGDADMALLCERTFQVCEVSGAFTVGLLLSAVRHKISPSAVICFLTLLMVPSFLLMTYPVEIPLDRPLLVCTVGVAFAHGGFMVAASSMVHEEYGTAAFGLIFGSFLTAGAAGMYGFDEIMLEGIFEMFADDVDGVYRLTEYGAWNISIFGVCAAAAAGCFVLALVNHRQV